MFGNSKIGILIFLAWLAAVPALAGENFIQLPPDSNGKKERTINQTIGGNDVHQQTMVVCDPATANCAAVTSGSAVKVDGSAVTQPVSIATMPTTTVNVNGTVPVSGTFWQATQPVSGTFWQATQPVSIASMPTTPVTGTFWQATQPVSGTFWQTTQPVSMADGSAATLGAKSDAKSTATDATPISIMQVLKEISYMEQTPASRAVTGTFWQATQPVAGMASDNSADSTSKLPVIPARANASAPSWTEGNQVPLSVDLSGALRVSGSSGGGVAQTQVRDASNAWTDVGYFAGNQSMPVTGTFWQATQPVSIASMPSTAVTNAGLTDLNNAIVASGTTAPTVYMFVGGKTNDGTPQYMPLPEGAAGRSVIVEGIAGGTAVPVSGTFWQATQPVSGTFWQATQPVSIASMPSTPVTGTFWQATQPVSGTVAATESGTWTVQPGNTANTTPWLAKIGDGTNSAAIKAASTAAVATDPALVVAISPNNVVSVVFGTGSTTKIGDGTNSAVVKAASTQPAVTDPALVVTDRADGATGAAAPTTATMAGTNVQADGQPTAITAGNLDHLHVDTQGRLLVRTYHSSFWSCRQSGVTTTTLCQAAPGAGRSLYVTDFQVANGSTTASTLSLATAAAGGCTTPTDITLAMSMPTNAGAGSWVTMSLQTPIKVTANQTICCRTTGSTAFGCLVSGFTAP